MEKKHCNITPDDTKKDGIRENITDAIITARNLVPPTPKARHTHECDHEYFEFWQKHDKIIRQAWKDYPFKYNELMQFNSENESLFIQTEFMNAVALVRAGQKDENHLKSFFDEPIPGVFRTNKIFTPEFLNMILEEIDHKNNSGIPFQRPNSMNRFGVILKV